MSVTIRVKRGTATQWAARTTPLLSGELGYDLTNKITKIGDGTTLWVSLPSIDSAGGADTGDITFDGVQIIGSGTASGDGYGLGTLELVPDGDTTSDQYLIIDPTAPNHIHIRAGGTQDASTADLFLGGERNNVHISDGGRNVSISTRPETVINTYTNINPTSNTSFVVSNTASIYIGDMAFAPGGDTVTVDSVTQDLPEPGLITVTANLNGTPAQFVGGAAHVFSHEVEWENSWVFGSNGVLSGPAMGGLPVYGLYNDASTESDLWISSSEKIIINGTNGEFLNDASIASNQIATMADITDANEYTDTAVAGLGNSLPDTYVPISDVGNPEGVASLDINGKIPDSEIPAEITRNTAVQTLTNKTIGLGTGITSAAGYDNITGFFGQSDIPIYQGGIDKGGRLNISSGGVITVANSGIGYASGIVTTSGGTRLVITVGGNALSGTLAEFNAALTDGDFATESYVNTAVSNLVDTAPSTLNTLNELAAAINDDASFASTVTTALGNKLDSSTAASTYLTQTNASTTYAPISSPTFTGTVGGITKSMVGLGNVDNTTDANKPVSTATQTALDAKLDKITSISSKSSSYTLQTADIGTLIEMSAGGTLTITDSSSFPVGFTVDVLQTGSSQVTIAGTSFTPNATPGLKLRTQWSSATLIKRGLNSWVVLGDLSA
jgi:hypothetical protein